MAHTNFKFELAVAKHRRVSEDLKVASVRCILRVLYVISQAVYISDDPFKCLSHRMRLV